MPSTSTLTQLSEPKLLVLSDYWVNSSRTIANAVFSYARRTKQKHKLPRIPHTEADEADNIGAEAAAALECKLPFSKRIRPDRSGDIAPMVQVRNAPLHRHRLLIRLDDKDEDYRGHQFILVIGRLPAYHVCGWIWFDQCKQPGFWDPKMPEPCWAINQWDLFPMSSWSLPSSVPTPSRYFTCASCYSPVRYTRDALRAHLLDRHGLQPPFAGTRTPQLLFENEVYSTIWHWDFHGIKAVEHFHL